MPILVVTGTDTDVGKTITTAALAAALLTQPGTAPRSVAVDKPTQTGVEPGQPGDMDEVRRLAGVPVSEGVRLRAAMAPVAAADRESAELPDLAVHVARIRALAAGHDRVLVEGAGGLLVHLDRSGRTLADLTNALAPAASVVVVCRSGLGTLNHTELTLEALARRRLPVAGLVIGSWPAEPDDIDLDNRRYLAGLGVPMLGAVPAGASRLALDAFTRHAGGWFVQLP
jgi:dethiobiotin synthase